MPLQTALYYSLACPDAKSIVLQKKEGCILNFVWKMGKNRHSRPSPLKGIWVVNHTENASVNVIDHPATRTTRLLRRKDIASQ
jgi:hypothetical protein